MIKIGAKNLLPRGIGEDLDLRPINPRGLTIKSSLAHSILMYLVLAHFHSIKGPRVFTAVPLSFPAEIAQIVPKFLDMSLKGKIFEFITAGPQRYQFLNFPFEIPSPHARGCVEFLLLSAVFEQVTNIQALGPTIHGIAALFQETPDLYQGFYLAPQAQEGNAQFRQIRQLMNDGFHQLEHKLEQFQIADRAFTQNAVREDTTAAKVAQIFNKVFITTIDARMPQGAAILFEAGTIVGNNIVPIFVGDNVEALLAEIAAFWRKYALGQIDEVQVMPRQLVFNVYECFECSHYPNIGKPVCKFDEGVLTSLLGKKLQQDVKVTETECYATGKGRCSFTINIEPPIPRKF